MKVVFTGNPSNYSINIAKDAQNVASLVVLSSKAHEISFEKHELAYSTDEHGLVPKVGVGDEGGYVEFPEDCFCVVSGFGEELISIEALAVAARLAGRGIPVLVDAEDVSGVAATMFATIPELQRRRLCSKALQRISEEMTRHATKVITGDGVVVVVGSGGREHAVALKLAESPFVAKVFVAPGNGGTGSSLDKKIENVPDVEAEDIAGILALVKRVEATLVFIGPERPLADGLANMVEAMGVTCFGPTSEAAMIEASKAWSKAFMIRHGIRTAAYQSFTALDEALAYSAASSHDIVVKASGLSGGKGTLLPQNKKEAAAAVRLVMEGSHFGNVDKECILEELLCGEEVSMLAFCDGMNIVCMPSVQDHKRVGEGDTGLNTGGMGACSPAPLLSCNPTLHDKCVEIMQRTVDAMNEEGIMYVGVLYVGFMICDDEPIVLEYNCRMGDPEAQVILPLLDSDLYEIAMDCCKGNLSEARVKWKTSQHAATVVCAAPRYPGNYLTGSEITLPKTAHPDVTIYQGGTIQDVASGVLKTNGGRVCSVTGVGSSLRKALASVYSFLAPRDARAPGNRLHFEGMYYRRDIGHQALRKAVRVAILGSTNGTDLDAIVASLQDPLSPIFGSAELSICISNKAESGIVHRAWTHGIAVECVKPIKGESRVAYDARVTAALERECIDFVLCVGWMRIFSKDFTDRWKGQIVNIHPSLLPAFAGGMDVDVHLAVLSAGCTETGCTVHEVTEDVDHGPIVVQKRCIVDPTTDSTTGLKARVQRLEGQALIESIALYVNGFIGPLANQGMYEILREVDGETANKLNNGLTYRSAGVNIDAGRELVHRIKPLVQRTRRQGSDSEIGGFGGTFNLSAAGFGAKGELLVASADGVGTKLKVAQTMGIHSTIGIDLVAMNSNDILTCGAEPLFFLDYIATGKLDVEVTADIVSGIAEGCVQSGCALIGGETAEMADMYTSGEYDLAGFVVGAIKSGFTLPAPDITAGDVLLGLPSTGIHSNGFSLVRKCVEMSSSDWHDACPWAPNESIGQNFLRPTKVYVKALLPLIHARLLKGMAHITGGGLPDNLPRVLPVGLCAHIDVVAANWTLPPEFRWLKHQGNLCQQELLRTFNCGIGMVLIVSEQNKDKVTSMLQAMDEHVLHLGRLQCAGNDNLPIVNIVGDLE